MNKSKSSKEWDRREYDAWLIKIEDSGLNKLLDEELWKLEPDRGDEVVLLFKDLILSHCYYFENDHNDEQAKLVAELRETERKLAESGDKALKNIKDLLSFMKKFHLFHKGLNEGVNEELNQEPNIELDTFLSKYQTHLSEYIQIAKKKIFPAWGQQGVLYFPGGLEKQTQRKHPQINGLSFVMAFFLRQYTDKNVSGEHWLHRVDGQMPLSGSPHYKLVAGILNATNDLCNPRIFSKRFTSERVKKRIKRLMDDEVELSMSIIPQYLKLLKEIEPR
jgi:hypothetical protein